MEDQEQTNPLDIEDAVHVVHKKVNELGTAAGEMKGFAEMMRLAKHQLEMAEGKIGIKISGTQYDFWTSRKSISTVSDDERRRFIHAILMLMIDHCQREIEGLHEGIQQRARDI